MRCVPPTDIGSRLKKVEQMVQENKKDINEVVMAELKDIKNRLSILEQRLER